MIVYGNLGRDSNFEFRVLGFRASLTISPFIMDLVNLGCGTLVYRFH